MTRHFHSAQECRYPKSIYQSEMDLENFEKDMNATREVQYVKFASGCGDPNRVAPALLHMNHACKC